MEFYAKRSLSSFIEEEKKKKTIPSSPNHYLSSKSYHQQRSDPELHFSPGRTSNPTLNKYSLMPPPSPDSSWTLSPLQTPSPSLLFHCLASLHRQEGTIHSIAVSKGVVFTGSDSNRIRAWSQPNCIEKGYLKSSSGDVRSILAYGNMLFTSHKDHKVRIWNITLTDHFKSKKITTLPRKKKSSFLLRIPSRTNSNIQQQHKDTVSCMAYYHAEGLLYTGSWDKTVKAWRVSDSQCVDSFFAHDDNINSIVVNQENGSVFTGSSDGSVKIWRRVYGQGSHTLTMTLKFQQSPVNALAISTSLSSSCFLYSGSSDGFVNFWEKEKTSGRFNHGGFLQGHRFSVLCLVAIEKLVFSSSEDTTIRVWRREEGSCYHECLTVLDAHRGPVKCLAAALEIEKVVMGFLVYSAGLDQTFKVWRIKVLPEDEKKGGRMDVSAAAATTTDRNNEMMMKMKVMEYEMSPVLSPSWVEKKLQGSHHPFHQIP